jgi:hypothetical protein
MSANSDDLTKREAFAAGMDEFVEKPFTIPFILKLLNTKWCEQSKLSSACFFLSKLSYNDFVTTTATIEKYELFFIIHLHLQIRLMCGSGRCQEPWPIINGIFMKWT